MSEAAPGPARLETRTALHLTLVAWLANLLVFMLLLGWASFPVALAIGSVVGFGGIGTVVARQLPPPAELRLGLGGFAPGFVPTLLLLVPAVLLASELDNWAALVLPRAEPGAEGQTPSPEEIPGRELLLLEGVIAGVLLRPVVEEFFFRGVLQQGLVLHYGARGGVLRTALLFALVQSSLGLAIGPSYAVSLGLQGLFLGGLLGLVRLASGSLLAAIALQVGIHAAGSLALLVADTWPIAGFNAPGTTTSFWVLLPALLSVTFGVRRALATRPFALPPDPGAPSDEPPPGSEPGAS